MSRDRRRGRPRSRSGMGVKSAETVRVWAILHAETLSVATLVRRIATISKAHEASGLPNPCRTDIVRATLRGVKRTRGIAQREAKPLLREDLFRVLDAMGEGMKDARDRALLLIGFAGGFRRSEIVALDCGDFERVRQGLIITLRRSKTGGLLYFGGPCVLVSRSGARGDERDPEARGDPGGGCRRIQPARWRRRGANARAPEGAPQRPHRPDDRASPWTRRQAHWRRKHHRVPHRRRRGALRDRSADRPHRAQRRRVAGAGR